MISPADRQRRVVDHIDHVGATQLALAAEWGAIESALRESEERFRAVWEATSEAIALSDLDGTVVAVNPAYCALYGLTAEQVVGQSFAIIFPAETRDAAMEQYHAVFADPNPPPSYETCVQHADGSERFVESRAGILFREGKRVAMISAIRDITERKRAERSCSSGDRAMMRRPSPLSSIKQAGWNA